MTNPEVRALDPFNPMTFANSDKKIIFINRPIVYFARCAADTHKYKEYKKYMSNSLHEEKNNKSF